MPAEHVGQDPSEEHADRPAAGRDEPEDSHRLRAVGRVSEQGHDQRERDCRHDRPADPLHRPGADEKRLRGGEAAPERREREGGDPDEEQAPVAVQVAEPSSEQEETAERQQVGVHDPRQ